MNKVVELQETAARIVRWVMSAAAEDETRPLLGYAANDEGRLVATDGFAIHAAWSPFIDSEGTGELPVEAHTLIKPEERVPARGGEVPLEIKSKDGYPQVSRALPSGPPVMAIMVKAGLLLRVLSGMNKHEGIMLALHGPTQAIEIYGTLANTEDKATGFKGVPAFALVMPMHSGHSPSIRSTARSVVGKMTDQEKEQAAVKWVEQKLHAEKAVDGKWGLRQG